MADCIVDTNVAVKWVLVEPDSAQADQVMQDVLASGGKLYCLDIALVEAANVIWVYVHRGKQTAAEARRDYAALRKCPLAILAATSLLDDAFDLAVQFDIAVYDACFVAAVKQFGCAGVTADVPLVKKVGAAFPSIKLVKDW